LYAKDTSGNAINYTIISASKVEKSLSASVNTQNQNFYVGGTYDLIVDVQDQDTNTPIKYFGYEAKYAGETSYSHINPGKTSKIKINIPGDYSGLTLPITIYSRASGTYKELIKEIIIPLEQTPTYTISNIAEYTIDNDEDNLYDKLVVTMDINSKIDRDVTITSKLSDTIQSEETRISMKKGVNHVKIMFRGPEIYRSSLNGP